MSRLVLPWLISFGLALLVGCVSEPELPPAERARQATAALDLLGASQAWRAAGDAQTARRLETTYGDVIAAQRAARENGDDGGRVAVQAALLAAVGRGPETPAERVGAVVEATARDVFEDGGPDAARLHLARALVLQDRIAEAHELVRGRPAMEGEGIEGLRLRLRVRNVAEGRRLAAMLLREAPDDPTLLALAARSHELSDDFDTARALLRRAAARGSRPAQGRLSLYQELYDGEIPMAGRLERLHAAARRPATPDVMLHLDALQQVSWARGHRLSEGVLEVLRDEIARAAEGDAAAAAVLRARRERVERSRTALDARADALVRVLRAADQTIEADQKQEVRDVIERTNAALAALAAPHERVRVRGRVLTPPVRFGSRGVSEYRRTRDRLVSERALDSRTIVRALPAAIDPAGLGEARGREAIRARVEAAGLLRVVAVDSRRATLEVSLELPPHEVDGDAYVDFAGLDPTSARRAFERHLGEAGFATFVPGLFERFPRLDAASIVFRGAAGPQVARVAVDRRGAGALARRRVRPSVRELGAIASECWYRVDDGVETALVACAPDR